VYFSRKKKGVFFPEKKRVYFFLSHVFPHLWLSHGVVQYGHAVAVRSHVEWLDGKRSEPAAQCMPSCSAVQQAEHATKHVAVQVQHRRRVRGVSFCANAQSASAIHCSE
jgi:hypothetical protein